MELYLPPEKIERNPVNGRFLKGHTPFNKGKKMSEWMDGRKIKKVMKCLELGRTGNPNIPGSNKRQVIGIRGGKIVGVYPSLDAAGRRLGLFSQNIRHCCRGRRKRCGGITWFYESDFEKWSNFLTDK
jgi:hypothetical protein